MEQDATRFWADIKKFEEALAKEPGSYCFAPLAEIYRRLGLLDEAIQVAKKGCELHPDYVGGFMALGRAYFDKGMKEESRGALEKVVAFTPDNLLARRLLGQIYVENGDSASAEEALGYVLMQNPADNECLMLLDSLKASSPDAAAGLTAPPPSSGYTVIDAAADDEEIIEDAEILEEFDDEPSIEEDFFGAGTDAGVPEPDAPPPAAPAGDDDFLFTPPDEAFSEPGAALPEDLPAAEAAFIPPVPGEAFTEPEEDIAPEESDPLITATMAELYVSQGFLKRALTIYRELLEADPDNEEWKNRLYDLKTAIDEDVAIARHSVAEEGGAEPGPAAVSAGQDVPEPGTAITGPAESGDTVVVTLERWLETIRRRR